MNDKLLNNDFDSELSPAEAASIDRILRETAEFDDSSVDYDAMLNGLKARAKAEGIVVFPAARTKKKNGLAKRLALGAATAAAVFVVGLSAMFVLNRIGSGASNSSPIEALVPDDAKQDGDKTVSNIVTAKATLGPKEDQPAATEAVRSGSESPISVVDTDAPEETLEPDYSPFPTEFPTKGGSAGYVDLSSFDEEPAEPEDLVPVDLPTCMNLRQPSEHEFGDPTLSAEAFGEADGQEYSYTCTVVYGLDVELEVGVAMYKYDEESGHITYIWRISEDAYLMVDFDGFTLEDAELLLSSLTEEPVKITADPAA